MNENDKNEPIGKEEEDCGCTSCPPPGQCRKPVDISDSCTACPVSDSEESEQCDKSG